MNLLIQFFSCQFAPYENRCRSHGFFTIPNYTEYFERFPLARTKYSFHSKTPQDSLGRICNSLTFKPPTNLVGLETQRHSHLKKKLSCCQFVQILLKYFVSNRKSWISFGLTFVKTVLFFLRKQYVCC